MHLAEFSKEGYGSKRAVLPMTRGGGGGSGSGGGGSGGDECSKAVYVFMDTL
jgi:hypothetical protein